MRLEYIKKIARVYRKETNSSYLGDPTPVAMYSAKVFLNIYKWSLLL